MSNDFRNIDLNNLNENELRSLLKEIRNEIDKNDKDLVDLLNKRFLLAATAQKVKSFLNLEKISPDREVEIVNKIINLINNPLTEESARKIFLVILQESRKIEIDD